MLSLVDSKTKALTEQCRLLCSQLQIEPESLLEKKLSQFIEGAKGDKDLARLHQKYYLKKRTKNLLKIKKVMDDST